VNSVGSVQCWLQNVKSQYQCAYWNVWMPEVVEWGMFSLHAELTGFLVYVLDIVGIVRYFCSSIRYIKHWIVIYYRGRKFPQRAKVLLQLEIVAVFTSLNDHSARKIALLVCSIMLQSHRWLKTFCEGTDHLKATLQSGVTSLQVIIASARSVGWGSNETVTLLCLVTSPSTPTYRAKTQPYDSHHWPESAVT
jgi:hypothetical protein